MAALQPAIYRRPDQLYGYDILFPVTEDPLGPWLKMNLAQPWYDNGTVASCRSYGALAVGPISAGYAHPGKVNTLLNGGLSKSSGSWSALTTNLGRFTGHYTEYTTSTGGQVSCLIPAGHDKIAVTLGVPTTVKPSIVVALAGATLETLAYGVPSTWAIDTRLYTVTPSATDRTLTVTCGATEGSQNLFTPIAVRSWQSTALADPRTASSGLHAGNGFIEYIVNGKAGYQQGSVIHAPNTQASDVWRLCKPNTWEPIIKCDADGGTSYKWTALGSPHYTNDDLYYIPIGEPKLTVDGVVIGNMLDGTIAAGKLYQADSIVISQRGTTTSDVLKVSYQHSITLDGIHTLMTVVFQDNASVAYVYGTSVSGVADAAGGLAEIVHTVEVPGIPTQYPTKVTTQVMNGVIDMNTPGCPVQLRITNIGPGAFTESFVDVAKVYSSYEWAANLTPAAGVPWMFASHVKPHLRETPGGAYTGVGIKA